MTEYRALVAMLRQDVRAVILSKQSRPKSRSSSFNGSQKSGGSAKKEGEKSPNCKYPVKLKPDAKKRVAKRPQTVKTINLGYDNDDYIKTNKKVAFGQIKT